MAYVIVRNALSDPTADQLCFAVAIVTYIFHAQAVKLVDWTAEPDATPKKTTCFVNSFTCLPEASSPPVEQINLMLVVYSSKISLSSAQ